MCSFNRGISEGTNSSKICVWCLCKYVLCLWNDWFGRLTWQRVEIYICEKSLEMCICLWPELDCPEVTLCGWQDIKIQLLLLFFNIFFVFVSFLGKERHEGLRKTAVICLQLCVCWKKKGKEAPYKYCSLVCLRSVNVYCLFLSFCWLDNLLVYLFIMYFLLYKMLYQGCAVVRRSMHFWYCWTPFSF